MNLRVRSKSVACLRAAPLLFALCSIGSAATYYVDPDGNDGNPGSSAAPFRTVSKGVSAAGPGDTVILNNGTYGKEGHISDGTGCLYGCAAPVNISSSGAPGAYITLKAANRGQAILDCGTTSSSLGCDVYIELNSGANYWTFDGLVLTGGAWGGISGSGSYINVQNCEFSHIGNWVDSTRYGEEGIGFGGGATNWYINGNIFHDIGRTGGLPYMNLDHGIYAEGTNVTITNNIFYNMNKGWSIQVANGATNWLIANNTFAFSSAGPGQIVLWRIITNVTVQNNIFYEPVRSAIEEVSAVLNGCTFDHNMVTGAASIVSGLGVSTNLAGCEGNNRFGLSPDFVNVERPPYDFHLRTRSAAIGAGVPLPAVTMDFDGVPRSQTHPSVGAYEPGPLPPVTRPPRPLRPAEIPTPNR